MPPAAAPAQRSFAPWPVALIALAVLLVFGRLGAAQFTWFDDHGTIADNVHLNPPTWAGIGYAWTHSMADIYAPLTYTLWGILAKATYVPTPDEQGIHVDPHVFHGANVLLHLAAALCVYGLLLELSAQRWAACAGALLFALHPLQVEAVGWASGTKDVMAGAFSMLALLWYVRSCRAKVNGKHWFICATLAFAMALLSKPSAVTLPVVAACIDWCLLNRPRRQIFRLAIWVVMATPIAIVNRIVQHAAHASDLPAWFRPFVPGDTLSFYLYKLVLPINLTFQYALRLQQMIHQPWAYLGWLIPLGLAILLWRLRIRWLWAAALIFFIAPLPVLGFVPFDWQWCTIVADHYIYVAMLGPAIAVSFALSQTQRRGVWIGAGTVLTGLALLTFRQAGFWSTNTALARHAIAVNPRAFIAHTLLGIDAEGEDSALAVAELRAAFAIDPTYENAAIPLKALLESLGRAKEGRDVMIQALEANEALPVAQQFDPSESYRELARKFASEGDHQRAEDYYRRILRRHPGDAAAISELGKILAKPSTRAG